MVCDRCKMATKAIFENLGLHPTKIELGEITLAEDDITWVKDKLVKQLQSFGFDLLSDKKSQTIEKIKGLIIELVQSHNNHIDITLSEYLSRELLQEYSSLSNLFSEVEGVTIEKYYISQKIEKVKELLVYDELTLSEIAYTLNYSSVAYLSNQFKKVTGLTPSHFKLLKEKKRNSLDDL